MVENEKLKIISDYWDEQSSGFDEAHNTEDLALWKQALEESIALGGKGKVLDVGCGTGFLAMMCAELGYETCGADFSEKMLSLAIEKAKTRKLSIRYKISLCETLPFEEGEFDAVVNCRVMWTLTDPVAAVTEWKRVLKNGGKVISFMRMMNVEKEDGNKREGYYGNAVKLPLSKAGRDEYVQVYKDCGLKKITTIELPAEMSSADMPGWTVFIGEK